VRRCCCRGTRVAARRQVPHHGHAAFLLERLGFVGANSRESRRNGYYRTGGFSRTRTRAGLGESDYSLVMTYGRARSLNREMVVQTAARFKRGPQIVTATRLSERFARLISLRRHARSGIKALGWGSGESPARTMIGARTTRDSKRADGKAPISGDRLRSPAVQERRIAGILALGPDLLVYRGMSSQQANRSFGI